MKITSLVLTVFLWLILAGCTGQNGAPSANSKAADRKLKIGFSMDTLKEEQWLVRKKKTMDYLLQKGFEMELVNKIIGSE